MNTDPIAKRLFGFVLILAVGGCSPKKKGNPNENSSGELTYQVILMGGQSNMVGQGKLEDAAPVDFKNVSYVNFGRSAGLKKPEGTFGPEVGLSQVLHQNFPDQNFLLIKYAIGGASLLDWGPNYDQEKAQITGHPEFGPMYQTMLTKVDSITQGLDHRVIALLWMQGERDARVPEAGVDYYDNFTHLITTLRKDLDTPNLPILFGKVNPPKSRYPALDTVVAAQMKVARELRHTYLIETQGLEKWADSVHYSSKGQLELGRRFGQQLSQLLSPSP